MKITSKAKLNENIVGTFQINWSSGQYIYINIINFREFRVWWRLSSIQINRKDKMLNENVEK